VFLPHSLTKLSLDAVESNLSKKVSLSRMVTLQTAQEGGRGTSPSRVGVQLLIQLLKSCLISHCASINFCHGGLVSSSGSYSIRSCFDVRETMEDLRAG
jgi:hypothetical protein